MIPDRAFSPGARLEDVRFSPSGKRLACVDYANGEILVFDWPPERGALEPRRIRSPQLRSPHAVAFLDEDHFVVANRFGGVALFRAPRDRDSARETELVAKAVWQAPWIGHPTAIDAYPAGDGRYWILVGNLDGNHVSRHLLDPASLTWAAGERLIRRGLHIPDSLSVSPDRRFIAVSSHGRGEILVYRNRSALGPETPAHAVLRGPLFPHSVRFSPDGALLLATDAGSPYLWIFAFGGDEQAVVARVIEPGNFIQAGNPEEGGAKAVDLRGRSLVIVAEHQKFRCLDFATVARAPDPAHRAHLADLAREARRQALVRARLELRSSWARPRRWPSALQGSLGPWLRPWPSAKG